MIFETIAGITLGYHPDSFTYLDNSSNSKVFNFIEDPMQFIGKFYYVLVSFFKNNVILILFTNIIIFALTNLCIYSKIKDYMFNNGYIYFFSCMILIFDPYRAHLSVHVLKDTLIIFSFILLLCNINNFSSVFFIFFGFLMRIQFYGYLPIAFAFMSKKTLFIYSLILLYSFPFLSSLEIPVPDELDEKIALNFREFDKIPHFVNLTFPYGDILRSLTWPLIRITDLAVIFHPLYFLFFFQSLALVFLILYTKSYSKFNFLFFLGVLAFIAYAAPGYNSYLRYSQPVITALFLWTIVSNAKLELKNKPLHNFKIKKF